MRVLVTGASGFIGSAIVRELLDAGHEVAGLARSDEAASAIASSGAKAVRGDLGDLDSLRQGAEWSEGVIHTAYVHDFAKFAESGQIDKLAIETLGEALTGSNRPLVVTSGVALLAPGGVATEDTLPPAGLGFPRVSEQVARHLASMGVNAVSIRLPPTVHGAGDHGFVPALIAIARQKWASAYVGDGLNHWPAVHRLDAAMLYRLVLEDAAPRTCYHGVAEEGVPFKDIAEMIGRRLGVPVVSKPADEAADHFGWMARFASLDCRAASAITRTKLDWHPSQIRLLDDLELNYEFTK